MLTGGQGTFTERITYNKYLDRGNLVINYQKIEKEQTVHWSYFTKAGWAWHVTLYTYVMVTYDILWQNRVFFHNC